jgi:hypothetical protein
MRGRIVELAMWFVTVSVCFGGECLSETARLGYGPISSVTPVEDSLVLVGSGERVLVVDLENPVEPVIVGDVDVGGNPISGSSGGDWAAVEVQSKTERAVVVIDLTDPSQPRLGGRIALAQPPLAMPGRRLAVGGDFVSFFDVSDPTDPRLIHSYRPRVYAFPLSMVGDLLAVGDRYGIELLDITNLAAPQPVATIAADGVWAIRPGMLFSIAPGSGRLTITDITDPRAPVVVSQTFLPFRPDWLRLGSDNLLVAANHHQLAGIDVSDAVDPAVGGTWDLYGQIAGVSVSGALALVITRSGDLDLVDLGNLAAPQSAGPLGMEESVWVADLGFAGDPVLVLDSDPTQFETPMLRVVDVTDGVTELAALPLPGIQAFRMEIEGGLAAVTTSWACGPGGCRIDIALIDVSDPTAPSLIDTIPTGDADGFLDFSGSLVATARNFVQVVDVSDPANPVVFPPIYQYVHDVAVAGRTVWTVFGGRLCGYDVTDPAAADPLGCHEEFGDLVEIDADGELLAVAGRSEGPGLPEHWIRVLDTGGAALSEIGAIRVPGPLSALRFEGRHVVATVAVNDVPHIALVDVADPANPTVVGLAPGGALAAAWGHGTVGVGRAGSLSVLDAGGCSDPVVHAAFTFDPSHPLLGEATTFQEAAIGQPVGFTWEFGEDQAATGPTVSHAFPAPEPVEVTFEISGPAGTDRRRRILEVGSLLTHFPAWYLVPVVAHTDGAAGTQWRTDLFFRNDIFTWKEGFLYLAPRDGDAIHQPGYRWDLPPGGSILPDLVDVLTGGAETAGALFLQGPSYIDSGISRTYTVTDQGTFGQALPMVSVEDLPAGSVRAVLHLLRDDAGFRTNMGVVNTTDRPTDVVVELLAPDGTLLGTTEEHLAPFGVWQGNRVLRRLTDAEIPQASARVWSPDPHSRIASWASVVDNQSGDAILVLPAARATRPLWIPAVAHNRGANGTDWRSEVEVCAMGTADARFSIAFVREEGVTAPLTFDLVGGSCVRWTDVLQDLFAAEGQGALRIERLAGSVSAASRTYTVMADGATYGQFIPAVVEPDHGFSGMHIPWLAHSTDPSVGYRSNLSVLNLEDEPIEVGVDLYTGLGFFNPWDFFITSFTVQLEAHELRQLNDVLADHVDEDVDFAWAGVGGTGVFLAYASVVDNRTGDPVFVMGRE